MKSNFVKSLGNYYCNVTALDTCLSSKLISDNKSKGIIDNSGFTNLDNI